MEAAALERKASRKRGGKGAKGAAPPPPPPAPKETASQKRARETKERKEQAEANAQREERERDREAREGRDADVNAALQRELVHMRKELAAAKRARAEPPLPPLPPLAQMPGANAVTHTHSRPPPQPAAPRLPPGWSAHVDGRSGATFYFKRETREKRWTHPAHPDVESEPSPPPVVPPLRRSPRVSPNAEHNISRMLNEPPVQPAPLLHATSSAGPSHVGPAWAQSQSSGSWAAARLAQLDAQLRGQQAADQARAAEARIELRRQQAEYEAMLRFPPHSMHY